MDDLINPTSIAYIWLAISLSLVVLGICLEVNRLSWLNWLLVAGSLSAAAWGVWNIHPTIMSLRHGSDVPGLRFELERSRRDLSSLRAEYARIGALAHELEAKLSTELQSRAAEVKDFAARLTTISAKLAAAELKIEEQAAAAEVADRRMRLVMLAHSLTRQRARVGEIELGKQIEIEKRTAMEARLQATHERSKNDDLRAEAIATHLEYQGVIMQFIEVSQQLKHATQGDGLISVLRSDQVEQSLRELNCKNAILDATTTRFITFVKGSAMPTEESNSTINYIADAIKKCPRVKVRVEGHTDSMGNAASNTALSQNRAVTVMERLVSAGVGREQLDAQGFGAAKLKISPEATEADREINRRIRFEVH